MSRPPTLTVTVETRGSVATLMSFLHSAFRGEWRFE
jgi:hypothetical protein